MRASLVQAYGSGLSDLGSGVVWGVPIASGRRPFPIIGALALGTMLSLEAFISRVKSKSCSPTTGGLLIERIQLLKSRCLPLLKMSAKPMLSAPAAGWSSET